MIQRFYNTSISRPGGFKMLKIVIFKTEKTEVELFLLLASRGRHAEIPYYQSVDSMSVSEGVIVFARLDCAPVQGYKVGCSGDSIITTESFAVSMGTWLRDWGITFDIDKVDYDSPEAARALLKEMRAKTDSSRREETNRLINEGLAKQRQELDVELLAELDLQQ